MLHRRFRSAVTPRSRSFAAADAFRAGMFAKTRRGDRYVAARPDFQASRTDEQLHEQNHVNKKRIPRALLTLRALAPCAYVVACLPPHSHVVGRSRCRALTSRRAHVAADSRRYPLTLWGEPTQPAPPFPWRAEVVAPEVTTPSHRGGSPGFGSTSLRAQRSAHVVPTTAVRARHSCRPRSPPRQTMSAQRLPARAHAACCVHA